MYSRELTAAEVKQNFNGIKNQLGNFYPPQKIILNPEFIEGLSKNPEDNSQIEEEVRKEVIDLCSSFPIYKNLNR